MWQVRIMWPENQKASAGIFRLQSARSLDKLNYTLVLQQTCDDEEDWKTVRGRGERELVQVYS